MATTASAGDVQSYISSLGTALGGVLTGSAQIISATKGNISAPTTNGQPATTNQQPPAQTVAAKMSTQTEIFIGLGVAVVLALLGFMVYSMIKK